MSRKCLKLLIAYDSKTGNVRRFVNKLDMEVIQISEDLILNEPFVLVTYTTGFGNVPQKTLKFLENNHQNMVGVAASGNRNWGDMFARSADAISNMYKIPLIHKFELSGTKKDVEKFKSEVVKVETYRIEQRSSN